MKNLSILLGEAVCFFIALSNTTFNVLVLVSYFDVFLLWFLFFSSAKMWNVGNLKSVYVLH